MKKVAFFEPISISPPQQMIYKRLGYKRGVTRLTFRQNAETQSYIDGALSLIHLKGAALRLPIIEKSPRQINLSAGVVFQSRQLASFLAGCPEIVLMAATAGSDIMDAIRRAAAGADMTRGVVLDATASEMVDASLDWLVSYFNQALLREGKALTKSRYSAGYGDFSLENQLQIFQLLDLGKIGITITESLMLIPEKSVTAIAGVVG